MSRLAYAPAAHTARLARVYRRWRYDDAPPAIACAIRGPGYPLIKRAIYYGCRQISAQYGSEFEKAEYENIKKVYSIWICFDPPHNRRNTITMYQITEKQIVGEVYEIVAYYDLMSVVMICLGTSKDERYMV